MTEFLHEVTNRSYHLLSNADDAQLQLPQLGENEPITLVTCHPKSSQAVISSMTNITWQKPEAVSDWVTRRKSSDGKILLFTFTTLPDSKSSLASVKKQIHEVIFKHTSSSTFIIVDEEADHSGLGGHANDLDVTLGEMLVLLDVCARDRISALMGQGYCDINVSGGCVRVDGEKDKKVRERLVVSCRNTTMSVASNSSDNSSSSSSSNSSNSSSNDKISPDVKIGSDGGGRDRIAAIAAKVLGLSGSGNNSNNNDSGSNSSDAGSSSGISGSGSNSSSDSSSSSSSSSSNSGSGSISGSGVTSSNRVGTILHSESALIAFVSRFADSVARNRLTKVTAKTPSYPPFN